MENKQKDQKLLAIMQFVHHYDPQVSFSSLLNGLSFSRLLNHIPINEYNFNMLISENTIKWSDKLRNLQDILFKIGEYFQQKHQKCIQVQGIDLIKLTKHQNLEQLIKYFQIVMALLMQSTHKEEFIQSIMNLQESSQQIFVEIIKNSLDSHKFTKVKYQANNFHKLIFQFQQQKLTMQKQIQRLCKANLQLLSKVKEYEQTINQFSCQMQSKSSLVDSSIEQGRNIKYLQEYINRLQQRIVEQGKQNEQQKINNIEKISELQEKVINLEQMEELCKIYKEKYDEIMDQMQKMNIWKRQKAKMEKLMQQKDFMVQKLHDRIQELSQKNLTLQQAELQLKLQIEKKQLKIQKMSNQLKKVMENKTGYTSNSFTSKIVESSLLDQSFRQCLNNKLSAEQSIYGLDEELNQMKKQNQKLLKKNKQFQKQICKLTKKVQRLRKLEQDKNKLQQLVFQLRITQSEQLNLMFAIFYEGFQKNIQSSKKLRQKLLNFNQNQFKVKKSLHKRSGSNLSNLSNLSKQNKIN